MIRHQDIGRQEGEEEFRGGYRGGQRGGYRGGHDHRGHRHRERGA